MLRSSWPLLTDSAHPTVTSHQGINRASCGREPGMPYSVQQQRTSRGLLMARHALIARRKVCGYTQEQLAARSWLTSKPCAAGRQRSPLLEPWQQPRLARLLDITPSELADMLSSADQTSGYRGHDPRSAGTPTEDVEVAPVKRRNFLGAASIAGVALSATDASAKSSAPRTLRCDALQRACLRAAQAGRLPGRGKCLPPRNEGDPEAQRSSRCRNVYSACGQGASVYARRAAPVRKLDGIRRWEAGSVKKAGAGGGHGREPGR